MPYFVVINEAGPAWDDKRPMREQKGWDEHAVFMDALADEHFVILGGSFEVFQPSSHAHLYCAERDSS